MLHIITSEVLNSITPTSLSVSVASTTGAVSLITIVNGTITETITPSYPGGGAIVINTTDYEHSQRRIHLHRIFQWLGAHFSTTIGRRRP